MSRGYLIYAYNNSNIDYGTIALCNSLLIKKNCKVNNVALVTSSWTIKYLEKLYTKRFIKKVWDHIIIRDIDTTNADERRFMDTRYTKFHSKYFNSNRASAYDFSPFDETILLDADYLMLDNSMDFAWNSYEDFMCNNRTIDLNHTTDTRGFEERFNDMSIPLYWATAVYFQKTEKAKVIFDQITFVKENYEYYRQLYNFIPSAFFRNDFSISIAIHIVNKFTEYDGVKPLPVDFIRVSHEFDEMHDFINGHAIMTSEKEQGRFRIHRVMNNVHLMNKSAIVRNSKKIIDYALS